MNKLRMACILLVLPAWGIACPRIYIIRHAEVQVPRPGWGSSLDAYIFKLEYNTAFIRKFSPGQTLAKIENYKDVDTIFCSPQLRAIQTANLLFDQKVMLRINDNLMELQYKVIDWPLLRMPSRAWLTTSMIFWMSGLNDDGIPSYRDRKRALNRFSEELIAFAEKQGEVIVVAHALVNRELIRILKKKGWNLDHREGYKNLSVNILEKKDCTDLPAPSEKSKL